MDIAVQVWLRDGHVSQFRCDENDEVLVQLISGPYILALYAGAETGLKAADDGTPYVSYPPERFFGSQAIYYPEPMREAYAKNLKENGVDSFGMPYDFLISEYSRKQDIAIFAAIPCLFEHIGEVSTGLAGFFHQAVRI